MNMNSAMIVHNATQSRMWLYIDGRRQADSAAVSFMDEADLVASLHRRGMQVRILHLPHGIEDVPTFEGNADFAQ